MRRIQAEMTTKQNVVPLRQNCQKRHFHAQINSEEQN